MSEVWSTEEIMGVERTIADLEHLTSTDKYRLSVAGLVPEFFAFLPHAQKALTTLRRIRSEAPCKLWGHDGCVYCSVHRNISHDSNVEPCAIREDGE